MSSQTDFRKPDYYFYVDDVFVSYSEAYDKVTEEKPMLHEIKKAEVDKEEERVDKDQLNYRPSPGKYRQELHNA